MTTDVTDVEITEIFSPTAMQKALLATSLLQDDRELYVEQMHLSIDGGFDVSAFQKAWDFLVQRHASLRSAFAWENLSDVRQVVLNRAELRLEVRDLTTSDPTAALEEVRAFISEDARRGFALDEAPLARVTLLQEGRRRCHVVITMHHAIMDGWSFTLLTSEMAQAYVAALQGEELHLPPAKGFQEYVRWADAHDYSKAETFWKAELADVTEGTLFPRSLAPTEAVDGERYDFVTQKLDPEQTARMTAFCKARQLTPNILVSAAWSIILHSYCALPRVTFGSAFSIRPLDLEGSEQIVGPLINTVPITFRISRDEPAAALLERLKSSLLDYQTYSELPLAEIVKLRPESEEVGPLFESLLVSEKFGDDNRSRGEEAIVASHETPERVTYPLTLKCDLSEIRISYHRDRFDRRYIEQMVTMLQSALDAMVADPGASVRDILRALAPKIARFVGPVVPLKDTLVDRIHRNAIEDPDGIAITDAVQSFSHRDLSRLVGSAAAIINSGPGDVVGVYLPRGVPALVAMLAVLECGACYLPLDPAQPKERLGFILADARPGIIIGDPQDIDISDARLISLEAIMAATAGRVQTREPDGRDPAYILYTSGSTGQPKGTINHYDGLRSVMLLCDQLVGAGGERVAQFASMGFDVSILEMAMAATNGGSLHVVPSEAKASPRLIRDFLQRENITATCLPPVIAAGLVPSDLPALQRLMTVGEPCPPVASALWGRERMYFNLYGPTEASIITLYNSVHETGHATSIGSPVANMEVELLDADLIPVPPGVAGQLWLKGPCVGTGYLGRSDLTERAYVAGGYLTGDDCYVGADGLIHFIGRRDHQIQIRGHRVELGEIESKLRKTLSCPEAVVLPHSDEVSGIALYAFVRMSGDFDEDDTKKALARSLPAHMVPVRVLAVDEWPLNRNLKIDRKKLAKLTANLDCVTPYTPCATETEKRLATIFSDAFNLPIGQIGREFDFFAQRGQSLMAAAVALKLRREFQENIPLDVIYLYPRLCDLAMRLDAFVSNAAPDPEVRLA